MMELKTKKRIQFYESIHCSERCLSNYTDGDKLQCDCGNDIGINEWFWEDENERNLLLDPRNFIVTFCPIYCPDFTVIRGDKPLILNMHYYWELKIITKLYATDVMIGVGTRQGLQNFKNYKCKVRGMLGLDDQTWGFSFHSKIQHDGLIRTYGEYFGLTSKVGVHLDMCSGKLEYYINRQPLGVAFSGLKNKELYPIVCGLVAQSSIKLTCSISTEETLQMLCLKRVHQNSYLSEKFCTIPGLHDVYSKKYFWITPKIPKPSFTIEPEVEPIIVCHWGSQQEETRCESPFYS